MSPLRLIQPTFLNTVSFISASVIILKFIFGAYPFFDAPVKTGASNYALKDFLEVLTAALLSLYVIVTAR